MGDAAPLGGPSSYPLLDAKGEGTELTPFVTEGCRSAQRTLKNLVNVGIRQRLKGLRPLGRYTPSLALWTYPTVPANLLHVVVQLDAVPIRIESVRDVVRAE